MMQDKSRAIRIFIADGRKSQLENLRVFIEAQPDLELAGCTTETGQLVEALKNGVEADAVIVDMILQGRGALYALQTLNGLHLAHKPRILLTTANTDATIHSRYMEAGAEMVVMKPYLMADLLETVRMLCSDGTAYRNHRLNELAHIHLERMHATPDASGYWYTMAALRLLAVTDEPYSVCKEMYRAVAEEMGVSLNAVESGIRRLIEAIDAKQPAEYREMREYLGATPGKPLTNNEFLSRLAQIMRLELQV